MGNPETGDSYLEVRMKMECATTRGKAVIWRGLSSKARGTRWELVSTMTVGNSKTGDGCLWVVIEDGVCGDPWEGLEQEKIVVDGVPGNGTRDDRGKHGKRRRLSLSSH